MAKRTQKLSDDIDAALKKRTRAVLIVEGIGFPPEVGTLSPSEFHRINVDDTTYQRHRTSEINELIHVLKAGGKFPAPVAIAVRPDGTWWLVDGLQRFSAATECHEPLGALFYKSAGPKAEALLYQALNTHLALSPDNIVKGHQGPGAEMLRVAASDPEHGLGNLVRFGGGQGSRPYGASLLIRGMTDVASGIIASGKIQYVCARLDHAIRTQPMAVERCQAFMKLIPLVFPPAHPPKILPMHAMGFVAYERWRHEVVFPSPHVYNTLKKLAWDTYFDGSGLRFLPSVREAVAQKWKASAKAAA